MILTPEEALARLQPQGMKRAKGDRNISYIGRHEDGGIYFFRSGEEYVATPANDALPSVIGRFDGDIDNLPPSMSSWLTETAKEVNSVPDDAPAITTIYAPSGRVTVSPLIKAVWGQGTPYNQDLKFGGKLSVVGCNAVAIGMIMLHWARKGYHRGCKGTTAYNTKTNGYKIGALAPVMVFDYDNMTFSKPTTATQKAAVSGMLRHIGYALKSDFTPDVTTAAVAQDVTVLTRWLRMGNPKCILAANGYDKWEQQIYNDISNARPVILVGYTAKGAGHCFVTDGYDAATDMYHVNWGWGGSCNGYFRLSSLDATAARAYNSKKQAIVGIAPTYKLGDTNKDGEITITDAINVVEAAAKGSNLAIYDINSDGKVTVADATPIIEHVMGNKKL